MSILRAQCALALIALVGLAGCQTGKSWLSSSKPTPSRDTTALAKSDYPVPPSKTATPPSINPPGGRTSALSSATNTPAPGSTAGPSASGGKYGAATASYNTMPNSSGGTTTGSSTGLRSGSIAGAASAIDPFPTGPQRGRYSPTTGATADARTAPAGSSYSPGGATYPNTGYGANSLSGLPADSPYRVSSRDSTLSGTGTSAAGYGSSTGRSGGLLSDRLGAGGSGYGSAPAYGSGLSSGSAPSYGAAPSSGAVPSYGSATSYASRPSYGSTGAAAGSPTASNEAGSIGSSLYQPLRSRAGTSTSPLAGDRAADSAYTGGGSGGSDSSLNSRDYTPGNTGYTPGSTGYSPPASSYSPGNTGYNPPGIPQDRPLPPDNYYQAAPAGSGDDLPPYRPGGTSDILRRSGTTSPIAGKSSYDPLGTAGRKSDSDVAPVSYDAQPDGTVRR